MPNRRRMMLRSAVGLTGAFLIGPHRAAKANAMERIRIGIIGAGGRATSLIGSFSRNRLAEVVAIADPDASRLPPAGAIAIEQQSSRPRLEGDFRRILDDRSIDAVVIATPDHWHAIPTVLACQAGKDVYVEKPDAHNMVEGQTMVAAMRRYRRIIQMGSQHRSTTRLQSAIDWIEGGGLGRVVVAKAWENTKQGNIGKPADRAVPAGVDYDMWLGPAPSRPFNPNRFHGRWRWFYDYGTGDLGNDGVHRLDMAMALLHAACRAQKEAVVGLPTSISAHGGKWYFDDHQEFPDTLQVSYTFGTGLTAKLLTYELRIWAPYRYLGEGEGAAIFGDQGYLIIGNEGWKAYDKSGRVVAQAEGDSHEANHVQDFLECVVSRRKPACDLETIGHPASLLCHTGNIAARVGRTLTLDPESESFIDDEAANALRGRPEYRRPWSLPTLS
jgi:predicted dehydrogenase